MGEECGKVAEARSEPQLVTGPCVRQRHSCIFLFYVQGSLSWTLGYILCTLRACIFMSAVCVCH